LLLRWLCPFFARYTYSNKIFDTLQVVRLTSISYEIRCIGGVSSVPTTYKENLCH